MEKEKALEILVEYNLWRRGAETPMLDPKIVGQAIDVAIECLTEIVEQQ